MSESNVWRVPRESVEWVGPIVASVIDRSSLLPVTLNMQIAVMPRGKRPGDDDWITPDADPDGTDGLGYMTAAVAGYQHLGFFAKDIDNPETPVLEPVDVGWLIRT